MGINKAILIGNLGQDPEIRHLPDGAAVANFSVATSDKWTDKNTGEPRERTEWHRIVAFRRPAEIAGEYLKKGRQVYIEGKIQTREWEDKNGNRRWTTEIVAHTVQMVGNRPSQSPDPSDYAGYPEAQQGRGNGNGNGRQQQQSTSQPSNQQGTTGHQGNTGQQGNSRPNQQDGQAPPPNTYGQQLSEYGDYSDDIPF